MVSREITFLNILVKREFFFLLSIVFLNVSMLEDKQYIKV